MKCYTNVSKHNTDGGKENNREWTVREVQIEGTIAVRVKMLREEGEAESVYPQVSIAESQYVPPCTARRKALITVGGITQRSHTKAQVLLPEE